MSSQLSAATAAATTPAADASRFAERLRLHPLLLVGGWVAAGAIVDRVAPVEIGYWLWPAMLGLAIWLVIWCCGGWNASLVCLWLVAFCVGGGWHHLNYSCFDASDLGLVIQPGESRAVAIEIEATSGSVIRPLPEHAALSIMPVGPTTHFQAKITDVRNGSQWQAASGGCRVTVEGITNDVLPGDRLRLYGTLSAVAPPTSADDFDFAAFERGHRRFLKLSVDDPACMETIANANPYWPFAAAERLRQQGTRYLFETVGPARFELASALLLGTRERLDRSQVDRFFVTGTIHLLAISGMHLAVLVGGIWFLGKLGWLPRSWLLIVIILFVIGYAFVTGLRPPVVRAAILLSTFAVGKLLFRQGISLNSLALAGLVLFAMRPMVLFEVGPLLSFLAVATLVICHRAFQPAPITDPLERLIRRTRPWPQQWARRLWQGTALLFTTSTVVWLVALPLVWWQFELASPIGLLLNPLLVIPVAISLWSGLLALVAGAFVPPLAFLGGGICDGSLAMIDGLVSWGESWDAGHLWLPRPNAHWVLCFYLCAAMFATFPKVRPPARWLVALLLVWVAVAMTTAGGSTISASQVANATQDPNRALPTVTILDVGHGLSVLLQTPDGYAVLYDAGSMAPPETTAERIARALMRDDVRHLDAVVLSHADADHFNALPLILERVSVGSVIVSPAMFAKMEASHGGAIGVLHEELTSRDIPIYQTLLGDRIHVGEDVALNVLHPQAEPQFEEDNQNSVVVAVDYLNSRVLLCGDIEKAGMNQLVDSQPIYADLVQMPHHGSPNSNPPQFLLWARPMYAVVSGGDVEKSAQSVALYESAGIEVFHTRTHGNVRVLLDGDGVHVLPAVTAGKQRNVVPIGKD